MHSVLRLAPLGVGQSTSVRRFTCRSVSCENADTANAPLSGTDTGVLKVMAVFTQRRALSPQ